MPIQSPYKLIVAAKDGTVVRTVDLAHRRTLTIGRSPRCDLTMDIESISRRHATMIFLNNTWTLIDADSKSKFKVAWSSLKRTLQKACLFMLSVSYIPVARTILNTMGSDYDPVSLNMTGCTHTLNGAPCCLRIFQGNIIKLEGNSF